MTYETNDIPPASHEVLASIVQRLLREPMRTSKGVQAAEFSGPEQAALSALAARLRVDLPQLLATRERQTQLLAHINSILIGPSLSKQRAEAATLRLAMRGDLRPSDYRMELAADVEKSGVRKQQIDDTVHRPDAVQHINAPVGAPDAPLFSFFAKRISPKRGEPYIILVHGLRAGKALRIAAAWRIPEPVVLRARDAEVLSILREFANEFGRLMIVPDRTPTKFIYNEAVFVGQNPPPLPQLIKVGPGRGNVIAAVRLSSVGVLSIALAYSIDFDAYGAVLPPDARSLISRYRKTSRS